jgi:serine/threonine-protein kinase
LGRVPGLSASAEFSLRLEKYELLEEIGHGGMATVYRARDKRLGREVAVKIIHRHLRENREVAQRFQSEARAVAKLKHANIVEVYDVSDAGEDERYLVVELVRGTTLRKLLANEEFLPPEIAACVGIELAEALDHAHGLGVIHRDVKPENVLVARSPEGSSPPALSPSSPDPVDIKITDFGIAKLLDAQGVTSTGQVLGSPAHMAPEQIEGGDVTARADVFGLGVLLYECMVGRLPFDGKNPAQVLRRVLDGAFTPADRARPTIGAAYGNALNRALAHDSRERFASTAELAEALRAELSAVGIESPRRELHSFLSDSAAYRAQHEARIVSRLVARAQKARDAGEFPTAAACYNRALAYRPDDPELLASVSTLARGERLRQSARRFGVTLLGVGALGGGAVALAQAFTAPAPAPASSASSKPLAAVASAPRVSVTSPPLPAASSAPKPLPRRPPARTTLGRPQEGGPELSSGVARVRILVDGPQSATVKIDGVPTPWFGAIQTLPAGTHTFEFLPPDEVCCEAGQTLQVPVAASQSDEDVQTVRGRIDFRPAILVLRGPPGSTASCGALGQFPVPSEQSIRMATGVKNVQCLIFPPEGSADPPKQFDVTLTPGRTSTNLGQ